MTPNQQAALNRIENTEATDHAHCFCGRPAGHPGDHRPTPQSPAPAERTVAEHITYPISSEKLAEMIKDGRAIYILTENQPALEAAREICRWFWGKNDNVPVIAGIIRKHYEDAKK